MKRIAITLGDLAGIGCEVTLSALKELGQQRDVAWVVCAPDGPMRQAAAFMGCGLPDYRRIESLHAALHAGVYLLGIPGSFDVKPGSPTPETARAALTSLDIAADLARDGQVQAIVTGPISKRVLLDLGVSFVGHTEYLAARAGVRDTVMMFAAEKMRIALVTTHVPIRKVAASITSERLMRTILMTEEALRQRFGVASPRIGILGLNPHAGEGGHVGREELDILQPVADAVRQKGIAVTGPLSPDTAFRRLLDGEFDLLIAMYHDQALPVVKTMCPDAVNVTLGLPYVRTSPDHGPAYDIAGKGKAHATSMRAALELAAKLATSPAGLW